MKIYLWNIYLESWVKDYNQEVGTYSILDAQLFNEDFEFDSKKYNSFDSSKYEKTIDEHLYSDIWISSQGHLCKRVFDIGYCIFNNEKREVVELNANRNIGEFKDNENTLVETLNVWSFRHCNWNVFDSLSKAIQGYRDIAIRMTTDQKNVSVYLEYIKLLDFYGLENNQDIHSVQNVNKSPSKQVQLGKHNVLDLITVDPDLDYDYEISKKVKELIIYFRFNKGTSNKKEGKLLESEKDTIRLAYKIMKTCKTKQVVSNMYSTLHYASHILEISSGFNSLDYLYVSKIDGLLYSFSFINGSLFLESNINCTEEKELFLIDKPNYKLNQELVLSSKDLLRIKKEALRTIFKGFRKLSYSDYNMEKQTGKFSNHIKSIINGYLLLLKKANKVKITGVGIEENKVKYKLLFATDKKYLMIEDFLIFNI